ncbi:Ail/Lom family outer membrane beta-barrel protein [Salmonella enterica subsp. enterica serovar Oranienburg]|nr:Ail/Lom family outer membrane beta-barrel protein [Salmonella enterica subsp. enterica serovar Oranienburg]EEJ8659156.1 Ail/Lom family outer membrane beta-barrel protein [Salmonella enterica subsp. enterica]
MALIPSWSSSAHTASFSPFTKPPGGTRHRNSITGNYCFQHDFLAPILSGLFVTDVVAMVISSIKTALLFDLDHLSSFLGSHPGASVANLYRASDYWLQWLFIQRRISMKKIAIVSGLVLAACSGMAYASAGDSTLSVGYAQIHSHGLKDAVKSDRDFAAAYGGRMDDYSDPRGVNIKYRYEFDDHLGVITSFTYASKTFEGGASSLGSGNFYEGEDKGRYFSGMIGPAWRFNDYVSVYAMAGVAYSKLSSDLAEYQPITKSDGTSSRKRVASWDDSSDHTSFAYSAGLQFNPWEHVAIDAAYEGSGTGDWHTNGFIVGIGYKF